MRVYCNSRAEFWLQAYAYSDNIWEIEVVDVEGEAVDLSGAAVAAKIKADVRDGDAEAVGELECEISDAAAGVITCRLAAGAVPPGTYYSSVRVQWPEEGHSVYAGAAITVAELVLVIRPEATREGA